jgi:hypothetical protein
MPPVDNLSHEDGYTAWLDSGVIALWDNYQPILNYDPKPVEAVA